MQITAPRVGATPSSEMFSLPTPRVRELSAPPSIRSNGAVHGELLPLLVRPARRLREREHDELVLARCRGTPASRRANADVRAGHGHLTPSTGPTAGAGAPGQDPPLERANPRLDEVDVAHAAIPSLPRAVLLAPGLDAPGLKRLDGPRLGPLDVRGRPVRRGPSESRSSLRRARANCELSIAFGPRCSANEPGRRSPIDWARGR